MKNIIRSGMLLCLIITVVTSKAQITKRNLLQQFSPQIVAASLIPQNEWKPFPNKPDEWRKFLPDSTLKQLISAGEKANTKEFPSVPASVAIEFKRNGNRSHYEAISFIKRKQLWDLMIAESIEGKGRFIDQIMNGVWSICEESFWGASAHLGNQKGGIGLPNVEDPIVDLFSAETASALSWTDYFVGDALDKASKLIRPRIFYEVNRRIFQPMLTANYSYLGVGRPDAKLNNWAPWVMSNYITASLLLQKNEKLRSEALLRAMKVIDQYINGLGEDGSCDEGPSYWFAAGGCVFDALNLLDDATGGKVNIYKEPIIQKMASYIYKTHIDGENFINVGDAPAKMRPDGLMLYRFGKAINDDTLRRFGAWAFQTFSGAGNKTGSGSTSQWNCMRRLYNLSVIKECASYPAAESHVNDVWLSDVQLMAARLGSVFYVASHGGNNAESHNHNDVGDFIVYANNLPLIIDVGRGTYTGRTFSKERYNLWFNTSACHNLPTVNSFQQKDGRQYEATDATYRASKKEAVFSVNIAKAYPKEAGIKSWTRIVKLEREKAVMIIDKYEMEGALNNLTQSFMTTSNINLEAPGKIALQLPDDKIFYLSYDADVWEFKKEKIELAAPEDEVFKTTWEGRDIWRILLTAKKLLPKAQLTYKLYQ